MRKRLWTFEIIVVACLFFFADNLAQVLEDDPTPGAGWAIVGAVAISLATVVVALRWKVPLDRGEATEAALAARYRSLFILRLSYVTAGPLIGFAMAFMFVTPWTYYATLPIAAAGLVLVAPFDRRIASDQEGLAAAGSSIDLRAALS